MGWRRKDLTDKGAYLIEAFRAELGLRKEHVQGQRVGSGCLEEGAALPSSLYLAGLWTGGVSGGQIRGKCPAVQF